MKNTFICSLALLSFSGCSKPATNIEIANVSSTELRVTYQNKQSADKQAYVIAPRSVGLLPNTKGGFVNLKSVEFTDSGKSYGFTYYYTERNNKRCGKSCRIVWSGAGNMSFRAT